MITDPNVTNLGVRWRCCRALLQLLSKWQLFVSIVKDVNVLVEMQHVLLILFAANLSIVAYTKYK